MVNLDLNYCGLTGVPVVVSIILTTVDKYLFKRLCTVPQQAKSTLANSKHIL